jgi:hypothetical protein
LKPVADANDYLADHDDTGQQEPWHVFPLTGRHCCSPDLPLFLKISGTSKAAASKFRWGFTSQTGTMVVQSRCNYARQTKLKRLESPSPQFRSDGCGRGAFSFARLNLFLGHISVERERRTNGQAPLDRAWPRNLLFPAEWQAPSVEVADKPPRGGRFLTSLSERELERDAHRSCWENPRSARLRAGAR